MKKIKIYILFIFIAISSLNAQTTDGIDTEKGKEAASEESNSIVNPITAAVTVLIKNSFLPLGVRLNYLDCIKTMLTILENSVPKGTTVSIPFIENEFITAIPYGYTVSVSGILKKLGSRQL